VRTSLEGSVRMGANVCLGAPFNVEDAEVSMNSSAVSVHDALGDRLVVKLVLREERVL